MTTYLCVQTMQTLPHYQLNCFAKCTFFLGVSPGGLISNTVWYDIYFAIFFPSVEIELGLVLLLSEIVSVLVVLVAECATVECVYQVCVSLTERLALWAPDHATTGLLAAIGLGRQSPLSLRTRFMCRSLATFLKLQMSREGTFRTHPSHTHR